MSGGSLQEDLGKNKPPRVQITYNVHTGNAIQRQELPFIVAILADLSGDSRDQLPRLKKRKFVEVKATEFDKTVAGIAPTLNFQVENRLQDNDTEFDVRLKFQKMEDFEPVFVAQQVAQTVKPFAKLLELRRQIKKLLTMMDGNDALEGLIQKLISDKDALLQLCQQAGPNEPEPGEPQP
jgi:type VI secretion system protein ImpB